MNDIGDPIQLDIQFYDGYDVDYIARKADTLMFIAENQENYLELVKSVTDVQLEGIDELAKMLRAEVYFAEFHQFEALFALMMARFQPLPHWVYLTRYKNHEINNNIDYFLKYQVKKLSGNRHSSRQEFIQESIYGRFRPSNPDDTSQWKVSLENIEWLLSRLASKYKDRGDFNSYKHGFRTHLGPSEFEFGSAQKSNSGLKLSSENAVTYLEISNNVVNQVTKHFNPKESLNHLRLMNLLLHNIKTTRTAELKGELANSEVIMLDKLNREDLLHSSSRTKISVTIGQLN